MNSSLYFVRYFQRNPTSLGFIILIVSSAVCFIWYVPHPKETFDQKKVNFESCGNYFNIRLYAYILLQYKPIQIIFTNIPGKYCNQKKTETFSFNFIRNYC